MQGLREIAAEIGIEVVIIRPPLVNEPGGDANLQVMMGPLVCALMVLDNLVDLIVTCVGHPAATNQMLLVSDGGDLSTTQLLQRMGRALGWLAHLLPVPPDLLKSGAVLVGKPAIAQRLCGSLQVDISKTRQLLGWTPLLSVDEGFKRAAEGYLREASV